jgi:hypothetical protein
MRLALQRSNWAGAWLRRLSRTPNGRKCGEFRCGGSTSEMVNLSRAKDAAISIALSDLNALDRRDASPKRAAGRGLKPSNHKRGALPSTRCSSRSLLCKAR